MTPQRVSLITLGTADLNRAREFYAALGWRPVGSPPGVVFYKMDGMGLGLFGLDDLARDQGRPDSVLGTGAMTLAQNFPDRQAGDAAWKAAMQAGATVLKRPEEAPWGGYSGYWADPDGHVWEIAHNPFWPIDNAGRITIPDEA
jgi:catechol 2,3-dioxygenase-like lactoylglutathione lyase family enzyme